MSDYTERGPAPVEDTEVDDPPTVDEVMERQRVEYPDQAATSTLQPGSPTGRPRGAREPGTRSPEKPVDDWATGDELMTDPQRSYLETLAQQAGEELPDDITEAQASELIERLQRTTGRGGLDESVLDRATEEGIVDQQAAVSDHGPRRETARTISVDRCAEPYDRRRDRGQGTQW